MEVTDDNLATLANYLQHTLNPDPSVRRPAEKFLEGIEVNQNYAILLLHLIDKDNVDMTIRVAAAIAFKNFIKRNWPVDDDGSDRIHMSDRTTIKTLIVTLMLKSPEAIQKQFSDAVSIIGKCDFPERWPSLIPEMVDKFNTGDFHVINGVLRTAHSLFKRYRFEFKSQNLWTEIKHVLENFAKPLTDLFVATIDLTTKHADNPEALKVIYGSLVLICKVFYSLNYQDLPEFFEDNMPIWMPNLLNLLSAKVPCLENNQDDESPGVMEQLRTEVCECASLYALKYDEEFTPFAPSFVTAVWTVLLSTGPQPKYDLLVSNALTFLAKVADKNSYKRLFEDPATLSSICEKVVIPNMEFRESDMELFEDNPEEYVRRDIEGSDVDTRRRAACDLVQTLSQHYEEKMVNIFGQYIQNQNAMQQKNFINGLQNAWNILENLEKSMSKCSQYEKKLIKCKSNHSHSHINSRRKEFYSDDDEKLSSSAATTNYSREPVNMAESWSTMSIVCLQYQYDELTKRYETLLRAYDDRCNAVNERDAALARLRERTEETHAQLMNAHSSLLAVGEKYLALRNRHLASKVKHERMIEDLQTTLNCVLQSAEHVRSELDAELSRSLATECDPSRAALLAEIKRCNKLVIENMKLREILEEMTAITDASISQKT